MEDLWTINPKRCPFHTYLLEHGIPFIYLQKRFDRSLMDRLSTAISIECRPTIDWVSTAISTDRSVDTTYSKHDPATLTHYIFITFLISTYIALMHQLSWMLLRGECCASEPDFFSTISKLCICNCIPVRASYCIFYICVCCYDAIRRTRVHGIC